MSGNQCPLTKEKCQNRISRWKSKSGCSIYEDINLCSKCTKFKKRQRKTILYNIKHYNIYRKPGCKL